MSQISAIAGTIQAEAGNNPANQFAVASVIYNRMQAGGSFPSDAYGVVMQGKGTSSVQFASNENTIPNATAGSFASDLAAGNPPTGGTTGNALNFVGGNGPTGPATAGMWASGTNIGGNYFSDNFGAPTANFVAPQYGGTVGGALGGAPTFSPSYDNAASAINPNGTPNASYGSAGAFGLTGPTDATGTPIAGGVGPVVGTPGGNSLTVATPDQAAQLGPAQQAAPASATPQSVGSTTIPQAIDAQSKTMATDTKTLTDSNSKLANAAITAANTISGTIGATEKNLFVRGSMIVVGLIFLGGALYMMATHTTVATMEGKIA